MTGNFGFISLEDGYIVATPPPIHEPVRQAVTAVAPATPPSAIFQRTVTGRPTGYSAGQNEQTWKQAVRNEFTGCVLPVGCRVQVEVDFVSAPDQRGRTEPDLDNLIKSTVDAIEGVLGVRASWSPRSDVSKIRTSPPAWAILCPND